MYHFMYAPLHVCLLRVKGHAQLNEAISHGPSGHPRRTVHSKEFWQNMEKVHWRREWKPTANFLPWETHEEYETEKGMTPEDAPRLESVWYATGEERKKESEVTQSCPTLCNPVDCSLPDFSVHGILQATILEWVVTSFSRGSSPPRDQPRVSCIAGRCFILWATREALLGKKERQLLTPPERMKLLGQSRNDAQLGCVWWWR